jgi:hypothetical protein
VVADATPMKRPLKDWVRDKLVLAQAKWRAAQKTGTASKEASKSNVEAPFGSSSGVLCKVAKVVQRASEVEETQNHTTQTPGQVHDANG